MTRDRGARSSPTPTAWRGRRASSAAMSVEALLGTDVAFAAAYQLARPHPGPDRGRRRAAPPPARLARSRPATTAHAHKVQDPYSLRCVPQVHGAVRDALDHLRRVLDIELNSATDNPLVFPGGGVADRGRARDRRRPGDQRRQLPRRADRARARLREARARRARLDQRAADRAARRSAAQRRPAAVPRRGVGLDSGLMIFQYTAAALASENKVLAHPGLGRLDPDEREPGGPRVDGLDRRRATRGRSSSTSSGSSRSSCSCAAQALDLRLALGPTARAPGRRRRRGARARSAAASAISTATASPGRTSRPRRALVHDGALADLAGSA